METDDYIKKEEETQRLKKEFEEAINNTDSVYTLSQFLNSIPLAAAILTPDLKAIFTNYTLRHHVGVNSVEQLLGKRPGEFLNCLHAIEKNDRCGISEQCKVCGTMLALKKAENTMSVNTSEVRFNAVVDGKVQAKDFRVTINPILIGSKVYLILYLNEISHEKRRRALERIFFHDVLNKISSVTGLYDLLKKDIYNIDKEQFDLIGLILNDLTDEIIAQRQLTAAENDELKIKLEKIRLPDLIDRVVAQTKQFSNPKNISIEINNVTFSDTIESDFTLLNRVITNLLKNALEASQVNEVVNIYLTKQNNMVFITIQNSTFIPHDIQLQIFNRSFSTKGDNRGLGTYSIKLLTERYLRGKVHFSSNETKGTNFTIELPMYINPI